jgi:hypothetical protein
MLSITYHFSTNITAGEHLPTYNHLSTLMSILQRGPETEQVRAVTNLEVDVEEHFTLGGSYTRLSISDHYAYLNQATGIGTGPTGLLLAPIFA